MTGPDPENVDLLRAAGFSDAAWIASGMEGEVYRLGPDMVGKVWNTGTGTATDDSDAFFIELNRAGLSFRVPQPVGRRRLRKDRVVTLERHLPGTELATSYSPKDGTLTLQTVHALITVLADLRRVSLNYLGYRVMGERTDYLAGHDTWADALIALIDRRLARYGSQLAAVVPGFDALVDQLRVFVQEKRHDSPSLVHGDIFGGNVLVDDHGAVTALLDWGFLTLPADPAFDAAITAAIFDMYGPFAESTTQQLMTAFHDALGYSLRDLAAYRGVYALITSNAYDPAGTDGHFAWCAAILNSKNLHDALT